MHPLVQGLRALADRWRSDESVAVATVVDVLGSTPATVGSMVAIDAAGTITGGITAGCVESEIVATAEMALANRLPVLREFGYDTSDELMPVPVCGGRLRVLIEVVNRQTWPDFPEAVTLLGASEASLLVVAVEGLDRGDELPGHASLPSVGSAGPRVHHLAISASGTSGSLSTPSVTDAAIAWAREALTTTSAANPPPPADLRASGTYTLTVPARPELVLIGAVEYARALNSLAQELDFAVTVCDARPAFLTPARFPGAELVRSQPGQWLASAEIGAHTAICVLSHDPRIDVPALSAALASPAGYIGALGARATQAERRRRLLDAGWDAAALARIRAPIGLDLQGSTPAQTALSILAEVVAAGAGGTGRPLSELTGPIHER